MLLVHVDDARRFGRVVVDEAGWIVAFREKSDDSSPALINAGIYVLQRGVLEALDDGRAISLEHDVFPRWWVEVSTAVEAMDDSGTLASPRPTTKHGPSCPRWFAVTAQCGASSCSTGTER